MMGVVMAVYPRWRGELDERGTPGRLVVGLSPLARGTLYKRGEFMETVRFIPAGAGNSRYQEIIEVFMTVYPRWRGELN